MLVFIRRLRVVPHPGDKRKTVGADPGGNGREEGKGATPGESVKRKIRTIELVQNVFITFSY